MGTTSQRKALVSSKKTLYCQMDKTFRVEIALCEALAKDGGDVVATQRVFDCLPTVDSAITPKQSSTLLDKLVASDAYTFLPKSAKLKVDMSREIIAEIVAGRAPKKEHLISSQFMRDLADRLQFYCRVELETDSRQPTVLTGKHALGHMIKAAKEKLAEGSLDLTDLEVFHVFQHMLEANEKVAVGQMTDQVMEAVKGAGPKRRAPKQPAASTNSAGSRGRGKSGKKSSESAGKEMDLFS